MSVIKRLSANLSQIKKHRYQVAFYSKIALAVTVSLVSSCATTVSSTDVFKNGIVAEENNEFQNLRFANGERIVFIGDSITHGGSYHQNVFLFNATRYPDKKIKYYNAGISGDTAAGTLKRFEEDVAAHKPSVATIMLGMNDVGRWIYETPVNTDTEKAVRAAQQKTIRDTYLANMDKLAKKVTDIGAKLIFITPSIFDETVKLDSPRLSGLNDELGRFGDEVKLIAERYDAGVIDFQAPMLAVNAKMQAIDPKSTIVSRDRVHPWEAGHFVMSHAMLKAQHESRYISRFVLDAKAKQVSAIENCTLQGDVSFSVEQIKFTCQPLSLPFPLKNAQKPVLEHIDFERAFNQQVIQIDGLVPGQHELLMNDVVVGQFNSSEFQGGVNIANIEASPLYQQALKVSELNDMRAISSGKLRNVAHVRYSMLSHYPQVDESDEEAVRSVLDAHVEKSVGKPWYNYLKNQVKEYFVYRNVQIALKLKVDHLFELIYQINKPQKVEWTIRKT